MLNTKVAKAFFTLLRSGLWNKPIDSEDIFPLSDSEWAEVFEISTRQTVVGIVFDGIQNLPSEKCPPKEIHIKWLLTTEKISHRNIKMNEIIAQQYAFFSKNGIYPVLLKGQSLAIYYENPLRRISGDIDWWFQSKKDFKKASELLIKHGIHPKYTAGYSNIYTWRGIEIDNHSKLFDIHNPLCFSLLNSLKSSEKNNYIKLDICGEKVLTLSPFLQILQVNTHILKHLLSFGIGIRQLCDIAIIYQNYQGEMDGLYQNKIYKKLKIINWIYSLHDTLIKYIGINENYLPFETRKQQKTDWMMRDIYKSGNFGFYNEKYYDIKSNERKNKNRMILSNIIKYFPLAPMESVSFPLVHLFSRLIKK